MTLRRLAPGIDTGAPFPVLHGQCGAERFTLLDSLVTHASGSLFGRVSEQTLSPLRGLRGMHLADPAEPVFSALRMQLEYLLGWTGQSTMHQAMTFEDHRWTGQQTVHTTPVDDLVASYGDLTATLSVDYTNFRTSHVDSQNRRTITGTEWAQLELAYPRPVSLDDFNHLTKAMADLMTLCAHAPAGALKRTLVIAEPDDEGQRKPTEVEVLGRQVYQPGSSASTPAFVEYLFTLNDVAFDAVLPAWLALYERTATACSTLLGLRYISQGYVQNRLLNAASAAEAMHRSLLDRSPYGDEEFKALIKKLLQACAGKDKASKAERRFIRERLRNELTYHERLLELAAVPDAEAVHSLLPDIEAWAVELKKARNGVAHASGNPGERSQLTRWAALQHALAEVTYALVSLVLLSELGLSAEVQRRAARIQAFGFAAKQFSQAVDDSQAR